MCSAVLVVQGEVEVMWGERDSILCANERGELDDAGHRSMMYPTQQWTFVVDSAT